MLCGVLRNVERSYVYCCTEFCVMFRGVLCNVVRSFVVKKLFLRVYHGL